MTFGQQIFFSVLTALLLPIALKLADRALSSVTNRPSVRRNREDIERENWQLRSCLRRVRDSAVQLRDWYRAGEHAKVAVAIEQLPSDIDPQLLTDCAAPPPAPPSP